MLLPKGFFMKKHLYFIPFIAISLFGAQITHTGNKPWYMVAIKKMNSRYYADNCLVIGSAQYVRTIGTIAYNLITHDKKNPEKQLQEIEAQLKHFETKLLKKEQDALLAIKNKFHIGQKQWNEWMNSIETLKTIYKQSMQKEWPTVTHNMPENIKNVLCDLMKKNNINPQSVHLKVSSKEPVGNTLAHASIKINYFRDQSLEFVNKYNSSKIKLYSKTLTCSEKDIKAICAHEVEHLVQLHSIVLFVIQTSLEHYNHLSSEIIEKSEEYQNLVKSLEQQAEILSSIKDPEIAACMVHLRASSYYPNYMYEKHYYNLTTIHMLWQLHAWVKYFHHGGIEKTTEEFKSTIEQSVSAFKNYCTQKLYA